MFYRTYSEVSEVPPADWCVTTLHTLSNKYEHLADSRKVNPQFAEAILNSFKSKLLNIISPPSIYDSEDISEGETEWPLVGDSTVYDGTNNYLTITPSSIIDSSASCYDKEVDDTDGELVTGLISPSLSPVNAESPSCTYLDGNDCTSSVSADSCDANIGLADEDTGVLPPSIEEALRRFLANTNNQVLSETFTTFADAESSVDSTSGVVSNEDDDVEDEDDDDEADEDDGSNDAQILSSESLSPESLGSPEEPLDYLSTSDPVDIFVKNYAANGSWEAVQSSSSEDALLPCKRKRSTNSEEIEEAEQNAASARSTQLPRLKLLSLSPRKRSRSVSRNDAAAVPTAKSSVSVAAEPSVAVVVTTSANETTTAAA
ncbi:hypothetical protein GGF39_002860 [Coemansia sp. RSA 1721]|nr:hypothetical protein GGF39_002860 [Coemansia sp. RSA 1721]